MSAERPSLPAPLGGLRRSQRGKKPPPTPSQLVTLPSEPRSVKYPLHLVSASSTSTPRNLRSLLRNTSTASTVSTDLLSDDSLSPKTSSPTTPFPSPPLSAGKSEDPAREDSYSATNTNSSEHPDHETIEHQPHILDDPVTVARKVEEFVAVPYSDLDLRLVIDRDTIGQPPLRELLESRAVRRRWSTTVDEKLGSWILRIRRNSMSDIHDAVQAMASEIFKMLFTLEGFLTVWEKSMMQVRAKKALLPNEDYEHDPNLRKGAADVKAPDASLDIKEAVFSSIVFESGKSEEYPELVADAKQWIEKGWTAAVVILRAIEDMRALERIQKEKKEQKRRERIAAREAAGIFRGDDDTDTDSDSSVHPKVTAKEYIAEQRTVNPEQYVGPILVTMEIWRRNKRTGRASISFPRIDVFSSDPVEMARIRSLKLPKPVLFKRDFFPTGYDGPYSHVPENGEDELEIDLEDFRRELVVAIRAQAHLRMVLPSIKKRKAEKSDPDYTSGKARKGKGVAKRRKSV